jgi:translocation protein SEC62
MAKKKVEKAGDGANQAAKKKSKEVDPVRVFAERVRDHKELDTRWAILQEARVEYFRGKDFITVLRAHPELIKPLGIEAAIEDVEIDIGNILLKRKLIVRCDRVSKTPRPGKTKLSKWPGRIEIDQEQMFSENDSFYAWTFERRRPLWQTVLSFLVPVVTLACCLFPVFPHWCKLGVLYTCLAFLTLIFGVLILRAAIFTVFWLILGKRIWFLPNILAEEATLSELFHFMPDLKDEEPPPKWSTRIAFAAVAGVLIWFVAVHGPNEQARARYQKKASNIIDDILTWKPQALSVFTGKVDDLNETVIDAPESAEGEVPETGSKRTTIPEEAGSEGEDDIREGVPVDHYSDDESNSDL